MFHFVLWTNIFISSFVISSYCLNPIIFSLINYIIFFTHTHKYIYVWIIILHYYLLSTGHYIQCIKMHKTFSAHCLALNETTLILCQISYDYHNHFYLLNVIILREIILSQKLRYVSFVFSSIAFKLYDLGQTFWYPSTSLVSQMLHFHSLLEFCPIPPGGTGGIESAL